MTEADRTRHQVMRAIAYRRTTAMGPPLPVTSATLAAELEVPLIVVEETMADLYGAGFIDMRYGMRYTSADRWSATATEAGLRAFHPDESEEPTA